MENFFDLKLVVFPIRGKIGEVRITRTPTSEKTEQYYSRPPVQVDDVIIPPEKNSFFYGHTDDGIIYGKQLLVFYDPPEAIKSNKKMK